MIMLYILHYSCIIAIICSLLKRLYCLPLREDFFDLSAFFDYFCSFSFDYFYSLSFNYLCSLSPSINFLWLILHLFLIYSTGTSPVFFNLFISRKALQAIGMAMVKLHASAQA